MNLNPNLGYTSNSWIASAVNFDSKVNQYTYTLGQTAPVTAVVYGQSRVIVDGEGKVYGYTEYGTKVFRLCGVRRRGGFDVAGVTSQNDAR